MCVGLTRGGRSREMRGRPSWRPAADTLSRARRADFSNIAHVDLLQLLADGDEGEMIRTVQEYYADFLSINDDLFTLNLQNSLALSLPRSRWSTPQDMIFNRSCEARPSPREEGGRPLRERILAPCCMRVAVSSPAPRLRPPLPSHPAAGRAGDAAQPQEAARHPVPGVLRASRHLCARGGVQHGSHDACRLCLPTSRRTPPHRDPPHPALPTAHRCTRGSSARTRSSTSGAAHHRCW